MVDASAIGRGIKGGMCALLPALGFAATAQAQPDQTCSAVVSSYDYVLGTQAFGAPTEGSKDGGLLRQARTIREMGSNVLKISIGKRQAVKYGFGPAARKANSALQYLKGAPGLQQALGMDFKYYLFWTESFTGGDWHDGVSKSEAKAYYDEMYALTAWLLTRYSGTGKVFMMGNWEGDWLLDGGRGNRSAPSLTAIGGMIDWLNIRQKAIDDAKAATRHDDVEVYQYVEVNLVKRAMEGQPSVAFSVLPATNVDFVSYSSYEAIKKSVQPDIMSIRQPLTQIVHYLEGQLKPKPGLPFNRRVFIGEYGYHANRKKPLTVRTQFLKSRDVMQAAIELNMPFALIWQLHNNEYAPDGSSEEMSLIDESGHRRVLYYLLRSFLSASKAFVAETCRRTGEAPSRNAFRAKALQVLSTLSFERMEQLAQEDSWVPDQKMTCRPSLTVSTKGTLEGGQCLINPGAP